MEEKSSNWSLLVALVSVIMSGMVTIYSQWSASQTEREITRIKTESSLQEIQIKNRWQSSAARCDRLAEVARTVATSRAAYFRNFQFEQRSVLEGAIWAGSAYLSTEAQTDFMEAVSRGPSLDDEREFQFVLDLSEVVLRSLSEDAARCRRGLHESVQQN